MKSLTDEIFEFLSSSGVPVDTCRRIFTSLACRKKGGGLCRIIPVDICALNLDEASRHQESLSREIDLAEIEDGARPLVVTRDRWMSHPEMMRGRLLSHCGLFKSIYARNCSVRRIEKKQAADFLDRYHSYSDASCRYRYGVFVDRYTGHGAFGEGLPSRGEMVAVAEFSNARRWNKGGNIISSYEWTRYACLPQVRVVGGMGKVLEKFIEEVNPDDVMSYADLEWSDGAVYEALGFRAESDTTPVTFAMNPHTWKRTALSKMPLSSGGEGDILYFTNLGSRKYRLKLTAY